tara:strand:- start:58 stop:888 length:831 start_codon:yes stop_codon:yes gene_type:complete
MFTDKNSKELQFLSNEQIKEAAPTVFTEKPAENVSKHYTHIPTVQVIDDMKKLGWGVVNAQQVKARKDTTKGFQKHLVTFRNPNVVINGEDGDTVFPQILLTNSHDGKNAFTFTAGLFRLICSNGLVIADEKFNDVKMRHMGYTFEDLQVQIKEMVEKLPLTVESMNKMKGIELNKKQMRSLAKKALTTRFTEDQLKVTKIDLDQIINPIRDEDKGNDLWSVFNVIQEKIIEGDFSYMSGAKIRKARQVKNFKQDMDINKKLFAMTEEFIPQEIAS